MDPSIDGADLAALLARLISYRTDVALGDERPLAAMLGELLRERGADDVVVGDVPRPDGKPASYVYARFGLPRLLVNAHIDTVPPNLGYTSDPFVARVDGGRLYGLGAPPRSSSTSKTTIRCRTRATAAITYESGGRRRPRSTESFRTTSRRSTGPWTTARYRSPYHGS